MTGQPYLALSSTRIQARTFRDNKNRQILHSCLLFHDSGRFGGFLGHHQATEQSYVPSFALSPMAVSHHGVYEFPV